MLTTKTPKPFADIDAAMDAFDASDIRASIATADEEITTAESVESFEDMDAALRTAEEQLVAALKAIRTVRVRVRLTVSMKDPTT